MSVSLMLLQTSGSNRLYAMLLLYFTVLRYSLVMHNDSRCMLSNTFSKSINAVLEWFDYCMPFLFENLLVLEWWCHQEQWWAYSKWFYWRFCLIWVKSDVLWEQGYTPRVVAVTFLWQFKDDFFKDEVFFHSSQGGGGQAWWTWSCAWYTSDIRWLTYILIGSSLKHRSAMSYFHGGWFFTSGLYCCLQKHLDLNNN